MPLTDEHERAALAALAALLAPLMADDGHDHTDDRHSDDTGGDHE
ncbi:MAG TPA: hypothetical protein VM938_05935 [Acidimicrobiales bacterium]|nr:hypothetical protein [Acidimicrobiales bacterium]